jgi:hypothetical protein
MEVQRDPNCWDPLERLSRSVPHAHLLTAGAAEKSSITRFGQPSGRSVAIDLQSGHPQTRDTVCIDGALPSEEFFYGKLIAAANFLQTDGATTHRIDYHRLRRATQRFVSGGGKSIAVTLVRVKISLSNTSTSQRCRSWRYSRARHLKEALNGKPGSARDFIGRSRHYKAKSGVGGSRPWPQVILGPVRRQLPKAQPNQGSRSHSPA